MRLDKGDGVLRFLLVVVVVVMVSGDGFDRCRGCGRHPHILCHEDCFDNEFGVSDEIAFDLLDRPAESTKCEERGEKRGGMHGGRLSCKHKPLRLTCPGSQITA